LEAESTIMQDASYAYRYARDILKERWEDAETTISKDTEQTIYYCEKVIKGRWIEAEEMIAHSEWKDTYTFLFFKEKVVAKDEVDIETWNRKNLPGYFAPARLFKASLLDMMVRK